MELHVTKFIVMFFVGLALAIIPLNESLRYSGYFIIMISVFFIIAGFATIQNDKW